jgi:hypothetical protein
MHVRFHHRVDDKSLKICFSVDNPHFTNAKSFDGNLLAAVASDEFIRRFQGFNDLIRADLPLDHPLFGMTGKRDAHTSSSKCRATRL